MEQFFHASNRLYGRWTCVLRGVQKPKTSVFCRVYRSLYVDDLEQAGYIAFMYAVDAFDPAKGYKFTTYLTLPLRTEFNRYTGRLTSKRDPLNGGCASLDVAVGDEGITPLIDLLEDPTAEQPFDSIDELEVTLQKISPGNAAIIRAKYFEGRKVTLKEHVKAFKELRKPYVAWRLRPWVRV